MRSVLESMTMQSKPLVWIRSEILTPPFSKSGRIEAGFLLRRLQLGESPCLPHCRPMPSIGPGCWELRIIDEDQNWRVFCRIDADAIVVCEVFLKKTQKTPKRVIDLCRQRLRHYDQTTGEPT